MTIPDDPRVAALESFAQEFVVALLNAELHGTANPLVRDNLFRMVKDLRAAFAVGHTAPLRLELRDHQLQVGARVLVAASLQAGRLWRLAEQRSIRAIVFGGRTTVDELARFLDLLLSDADRDAFAPGSVARVLAQRGIANLQVVLVHDEGAPVAAGGGADIAAVTGYQALADVLQDQHIAAHRGREIEVARAKGVVEQAMERLRSMPSDLLSLANYDDIDSFTVGHSVRVTLLALHVAKATGTSRENLMLVGTAALMHDIGKSRIPQSILFKRGRLEPEEWAEMARHPRLGAEILLEQKGLHPSAIGAAFCHHMAPGGYPRPAIAFDPSGISKLVRVCDVFEALTAIRPYKKALSPVEAHVIMHREAASFDPVWLRWFVQVIGLYPLGTRLRLDTGETAIVERHGPSCDRPEVRLLTGSDGGPPVADAPRVVPIGVPVDGVTRSIASVIVRGRDARDDPEQGQDPTRIVEAQPHACFAPRHDT